MSVGLSTHAGFTALGALLRLEPVDRVVRRATEADCEPREAIGNPGQWYAKCPCPQHDDEDPSLAIGPNADGRGAEVMCHGGCDWRDVLKALGLHPSILTARGTRGARLSAESAKREELAVRRSNALMQADERLTALLRHEGWTIDALESLMVGSYGPHQLAIPERDHFGAIVGVALHVPHYQRGENAPLAKSSEPGGTRGMAYRAGGPASSTLVLVEGPACAIAAQSLGFEAVSRPSATSALKTGWRRLFAGREVVILPDADRAGRKAAQEAAALLVPCCESVRVPELYPDGVDGEDVADLLREHSAGRSSHPTTSSHRRIRSDRTCPTRTTTYSHDQRGGPPTS